MKYMKYLAIFFWASDDTSTWSVEVDTLDKQLVIDALLKHGNHTSLDDATILICESNYLTMSEILIAPKVIRHWSALNGDFE